MEALVEPKRRTPSSDMLSDLVVRLDDGSDTAVTVVARLGAALLFAAHETTVTAIDKGVLLRAANDLASTLRGRPGLVDAFVGEVLRLPLPVSHGARWRDRTAPMGERAGRPARREDQPGRARAARPPGRQPRRGRLRASYPRPASTASPALAFGHNPHFCLGAPLARLELRTLFGSLVRRFPGLHLAVPIEALGARSRLLTGGLHGPPVEW